MSSGAFVCQQCGAAMTVPSDPSAMAARCVYCGRENPLPYDILARREEKAARAEASAHQAQIARAHQQAVKSSSRLGLWITLFAVLPGIAIAIAVVLTTLGMKSSGMAPSPAAREEAAPVVRTAAAPTPVAELPRAPPRDIKVVEQRMTALMKQKYDAGCKHVMMSPHRAVGSSSQKATLSKGPLCMTIIAISGADDSKLTISMTTPLGEHVATPPPATEVIFPYCAEVDGDYPITISGEHDENYFLEGSVDCPATLVKPKKK